MFSIQGQAVFSEDDIHLGEQFEQTLINEGFGVRKEYRIQSPALLIINFGVDNTDTHKPDTEFKMN